MGRPRKPTQTLKLHGTFRPDRHESDLDPPKGRPKKPKNLSEAAQEVWCETLDRIETMGVLHEVDAASLERYCEIFVRWRLAEEQIQTEGSTIETYNRDGQLMSLKISPHVTHANQCAKLLLDIETKFGLNPSSRSGLITNQRKNKKGGLDEFVGKRKA